MKETNDSNRKRAWGRRIWQKRVIICVVIVLLSAMVLTVWMREPRFYTVTVLPTYEGHVFQPCAMNDHGLIVGFIRYVDEDNCQVGLWNPQHGIRELGVISGMTFPLSINDKGQIAGTIVGPDNITHAFFWDPNTGMTELNAPEQVGSTMAYSMDNDGRVVGQIQFQEGFPQACVWQCGHSVYDFNLLEEQRSFGQKINDSGQVFGLIADGQEPKPCLWEFSDANSMAATLLPGPNAHYCDLNGQGYVLGCKMRLAEGTNYAMLWRRDEGLTWLFPLRDLNAKIHDLNDANQVLYSETWHSNLENWIPKLFPSRKRSFLWDPKHGSVVIDKGLGLERGDFLAVTDLNNNGCIIGVVRSKSGEIKRSILLEPISKR